MTDVDALASVARDDELALTIDGTDYRLTVEHRVLEPQFPPASVADERDHDPVPGAFEIACLDERGRHWSLRLPCDLDGEPTGEVRVARQVVVDLRVPVRTEWRQLGAPDEVTVQNSTATASDGSRAALDQ